MTEKKLKTYCPANRREWRDWLLENHDKEKSVWVIFHKKSSGLSELTWSEAVDEALCFGWIDSTVRPLDEGRFIRYFGVRKPKSVWSRINKDKIERLTADGMMTEAGLAAVATAQKNGSWNTLDEAETLVIPEDLTEALKKKPDAMAFFANLSRSDKKMILQWLLLAKRPETRRARIMETVECAEQRLKPGVFRWEKPGPA